MTDQIDRVLADMGLPTELIHQKIAAALKECRLQSGQSIAVLAQVLNVKEEVIQRLEQKIADEDYGVVLQLLRYYSSIVDEVKSV